MITIGFSTRKIDNDFIEVIKKTSGVSNPEIIPVENNGQLSLTEVYNKILNDSKNDIVILCHDDIYFDSKNWGQKILKHFKRKPNYGILGLAGTTHMPKSAKWWEDFSKMKGIVKEPEVVVESYVTLNGKASRLIVDKTTDLSIEEDNLKPKKWIIPNNQ